ncbi:MAG: trypsin-like peptidase domain-containing protein [Thermomicrobiales bacterium]
MVHRRFLVTLALLFALLPGLRPSPAAAQIDPLILGRAIDATVRLSIIVKGTVDDEEQIIWYAVGSGTVVSPDGIILTNRHLITPKGIDEKLAELRTELAAEGKKADLDVDADHFMIAVSDGRHLPEPRYVAAVVAQDDALDLAVLRIEGDARGDPLAAAPSDLPAMPLGDSDALNLGDPVHVFGFPRIGSGSLTYTAGVVSGFLYEDGVDGTAWINTDAVTSGGNSGGAAMNQNGELIGIPTTGAALDCLPGDVNRDGVEDDADVGCLPTGGSLAQLRPINLAKPLLASVDPELLPEEASSQPVTAADAANERIVAARGCAQRGDWQCATHFFAAALANAPEDQGLLASLYDAYLSLGYQEQGAGRLESARTAFASAADIDPARTDAPVALARIAPYGRLLVADRFDSDERFVAGENGGATSAYADGAFTLTIDEPGLVSGYPLTEQPLQGQDYAALLVLASAEGDGMVTIETHASEDEQYVFAVDPERQTWEVLHFDPAEQRFMPWGGPYGYGTASSEPLKTVELRVRDGFPILLLDGVDVAALASASLPEVGGEGEVRFGALMASEGSTPFKVAFDEIGLYELR